MNDKSSTKLLAKDFQSITKLIRGNMKYEYLALEGDSPLVPTEMLNERGEDGWIICATVERTNENNQKRWVFYFYREKKSSAVT